MDLDAEQIIDAVEKDRAYGNPRIPSPTEKELTRLYPSSEGLPRVTGARSWKEVAASSRAYLITFSPERITLRSYRFTTEGKPIRETRTSTEFPGGTPGVVVVQALVDDAKSRPELSAGDNESHNFAFSRNVCVECELKDRGQPKDSKHHGRQVFVSIHQTLYRQA